MAVHCLTGAKMGLEGKILISHPGQPAGSYFHKAVIYLYQDSIQGSLGVMLNKPSSFTLKDVCLDKKMQYLNSSHPVYHGGPVNDSALILLHTEGWQSKNTAKAQGNLFLTSDNFMLERLALNDTPANWRLFGGLCGWAPGQLRAELDGTYPYKKENQWLYAEADNDFIFSLSGEKQWKYALDISSQQLFDRYL